MPIINNSSLKRKAEDSEPAMDERDLSQISIQELLLSFSSEINKRLDKIDQRLDTITETCDAFESKIEQITSILNNGDEVNSSNLNSDSSCVSSVASCSSVIPFDAGVTVITLNTAEAYPDGSWLGDENKPELRVRCPVSPTELLYINTTCATPEKMALTLLDHLFDRDTQACSNISGTGKYNKKRLDPLLIYGIQCHLISHFGTGSDEWTRIKQNIDSKCRTAFRKKKGALSSSKDDLQTSSQDLPDENVLNELNLPVGESSIGNLSTEEETHPSSTSNDNIVTHVIPGAEAEGLEAEDLQFIHATPEELAEIERTHKIQVLPGGHILATPLNELAKQGDEES